MLAVLSHALDKAAYAILVGVLFLAPFPVASNRDGLIGVTTTLLCLGVSFTLLSALAGAMAPTAGRANGRPATLLALPGTLSQVWLGMLALVAAWIWMGPHVVAYPVLDLARAEVYQAKALAYLCTGALILLEVNTRQRVLVLLTAIVVSSTIEALAAILELSLRTEFTLFGVQFFVLNRATGTFANPDHFANYMAMSMALGIGLMLGTAKEAKQHKKGWQAAALRFFEFVMSPRMVLRLALVVMVIGLVLSRSRMGNVAFGLALLILLGSVAYAWPKKRAGALWLGASLVVVDLVVIGQWVGLEHVVSRLEKTELTVEEQTADAAAGSYPGKYREETVEERLSIGRDAFKLVQQSPLVGHGPATFYALFPQVKSPTQLQLWFDHAHNDYVELAADLGVPALLVLGVVVTLSLSKWAQLMRSSPSTLAKGVACGCGMVVFCMLMHAVVDFNLHVHANALLFTAALALPFSVGQVATRQGRSRRAH